MLGTVVCYYRVIRVEELWIVLKWNLIFRVLIATDVLQASEENEFMLHHSVSFNSGCPKVYIVNQTSAGETLFFIFM